MPLWQPRHGVSLHPFRSEAGPQLTVSATVDALPIKPQPTDAWRSDSAYLLASG